MKYRARVCPEYGSSEGLKTDATCIRTTTFDAKSDDEAIQKAKDWSKDSSLTLVRIDQEEITTKIEI